MQGAVDETGKLFGANGRDEDSYGGRGFGVSLVGAGRGTGMKKTIAVFARAPVAGRVKTRLARHLGDDGARALYAAMLGDTLTVAKRAARDLSECEVVVAFTPHDAFEPGPDSLFPFWSGARMAQCQGDIGARMLDCIARLQQGNDDERGNDDEQGGAQVVLIGSDAPDLPVSCLMRAFEELERGEVGLAFGSGERMHDLVFGPALDGGFYLIGAAKPVPPKVFQDVEWSSPQTLEQVKANARRLNLRLAMLPRHGDLDALADLQRFIQKRRFDGQDDSATRRFLLSHKLFN